MIQFDRIEDNRVYLGFTQAELDFILNALVKYESDNEHTNRLDVLAMVFHQEKLKQEKRD
jgi:hypothetical protein